MGVSAQRTFFPPFRSAITPHAFLKRYSHFRRSLLISPSTTSPTGKPCTIFTPAAASSTVTDDLGPTSLESRLSPTQQTQKLPRSTKFGQHSTTAFDKVGAQHHRFPPRRLTRLRRIRYVHLPIRLARPTRAFNPLAFDLAARAATVSQPCLRGTFGRPSRNISRAPPSRSR